MSPVVGFTLKNFVYFLYSFKFIKIELTAVGSCPPVSNYNTQTGTGFGVTAKSNTQALLQIAATVTRSLDACLKVKINLMLTGAHYWYLSVR